MTGRYHAVKLTPRFFAIKYLDITGYCLFACEMLKPFYSAKDLVLKQGVGTINSLLQVTFSNV